ncbi:hypothetical protein JW992_13135 [candidate division KSB1 bacterium]|nr:hypothetical protein [candidate division KSB1 bacterium]
MKNRILVLVTALTFIAAIALAQPRQRLIAKEELKLLIKELELSETQAADLKPILEKQRQEMEDIFRTHERGPAMRQALIKTRETFDGEIENILTEEQMKTYRERQKERQERWRDSGNRPKRPGR